ncbi:hypothetical protein Z517_12387 [Fonsecaea pedrosoi CBS 271.37]|uniref:Cytochrome b-c1 complex subunit 8 n=1 Tax=Fonsecaea pedrosoi CBS 271.37 TaxID=1442368 RepID=A0A0D2EJA4_9EURO|nr:uncharacterized protein Z517_12387 [Fonsecaea pedrosoi CBS 271.37]KIW74447.1 hypothetical protein Z517_12387 [Fonsecaea pedrosoi CBS 271.37]
MRPTPALRMQATRILRSGHGPDPKNGVYGIVQSLKPSDPSQQHVAPNHQLASETTNKTLTLDTGSPTQKNIVTYAMSPNRQNPTSTLLSDAIFNTFRRSRNQVLYWVPPFLIAYLAMDWATERNEYLNSKPGRAEYEE